MKYINFSWKFLVVVLVLVIALTQYQGVLANTTYTVSGRITDQSGTLLTNTTVTVNDPSTGTTINSTQTDLSGFYTLFVDEGVYNLRVTPPSESGLGSAVVLNKIINNNAEIDFVLVPTGSTTLTGRLVDVLGNPVPNQRIGLAPTGTSNYEYQYTGGNGEYSFEVAPGNYAIDVSKYNSPESNTPTYLDIKTSDETPIHLEVDTVLDVVLPARQVRVHIQDPAGNPVAGVSIHTNYPYNPHLAMGTYELRGRTGYPTGYPTVVTDTNGNVTLWLNPTYLTNTYTFTVTPPEDLPFITFNLYDIYLIEDKDIVIVLQFAHDPPMTNIAMLDTPNSAGEYPDPTTVALSATATEGYSIDVTYYSVDGGAQQVYIEPFTVSGGDLHSIEYWSVDNLGVFELPNTHTFTVVTNQPPVASAGGPYTVNEGSSKTLDASESSDPDDNIVLYEWDLDNDGEYNDATGVTTDVSYPDNGTYTVGLKVTDDYGVFDTDTAEITVLNVAPTIETLTAPVDPIAVGVTVETSATFTDPGILDTHTATWDWGDNSNSAGTVGGYNVSGFHIYETPGVYTLTLTVEDDDGGTDTSTFQYVVIYDPEGGFVTGGGWIWSPEGAYLADPLLEGKATFGFVSKYKKGATMPTGNTEFQFHTADLNFKSTSYDWLVIAGSKAMYKGIGTINDMGEYGFMLSAIDGSPDKFRVKIWEKATEVVIYDNQLDAAEDADPVTELGGGSIVVHKAK